MKRYLTCAGFITLLALYTPAFGLAAQPNPYPTMAPIAKYMMPRAAEIAMARSAAPPSLSAHAGVMVMIRTGYEVVDKGTNGWMCVVGRMWTAGVDDPEFWNPNGRGAACLNPEAVRSVLPFYVARTEWALAGATREQIAAKSQAAYAAHQFPEPSGFALMLSKQSYLNDGVKGPWRPHIMPFVAKDKLASWSVGYVGSPILSPATATFRYYEPVTLVILAPRWSDGSPAPKM